MPELIVRVADSMSVLHVVKQPWAWCMHAASAMRGIASLHAMVGMDGGLS